jgi:hypothetical protein
LEPHKQAKYSKSLDPDEIEEVLMAEKSDEELEDRYKVVEPHVQSSSSSEDDDGAKEIKVTFRATRARDLSNFFHFTEPRNGVIQSAASDINAESSPFSIFILSLTQVFQIILTKRTTNSINTCHLELKEALQHNHLILPLKKCTHLLDLQFKWGMNSVTASKVIGPERSSTALHFIQT